MARVFEDPQPRWFEDFALGDLIETRGRTLEAADFHTFAGLVGNYYPLHIDAEFGRETRFGTRVGHGSLTLSLAIGLVGMSGYLGDAVVAQLEIEEVRATAPVRPGDTLRVVGTVTECAMLAEDSRHGRLAIHYSTVNQDGEEVMSFEQKMLVRRRNQEERGEG
jgi:3-hydroxybutyryl-CoA dehydratase